MQKTQTELTIKNKLQILKAESQNVQCENGRCTQYFMKNNIVKKNKAKR